MAATNPIPKFLKPLLIILGVLLVALGAVFTRGVAHNRAVQEADRLGTRITDAGLGQLTSYPNLRRIILYETAVTVEVTEKLRTTLPDCYINHGDYWMDPPPRSPANSLVCSSPPGT